MSDVLEGGSRRDGEADVTVHGPVLTEGSEWAIPHSMKEGLLPKDTCKEMSPKDAREVRAVLKALAQRVRQLQRRVEEQDAQLRRNYRNSSQPPSSDPVGQKRRQKEPTGGKRGAQPGRPRHERQSVPLAKVAEVRAVRPDRCPCCGEGLHGVEPNPNPERHQVTDISEPEARTAEYQVYSAVCPRCGHRAVGELPTEARRALRPYLTAFVAHLKLAYRLPLRQRSSVRWRSGLG